MKSMSAVLTSLARSLDAGTAIPDPDVGCGVGFGVGCAMGVRVGTGLWVGVGVAGGLVRPTGIGDVLGPTLWDVRGSMTAIGEGVTSAPSARVVAGGTDPVEEPMPSAGPLPPPYGDDGSVLPDRMPAESTSITTRANQPRRAYAQGRGRTWMMVGMSTPIVRDGEF